MDGNTLSVERVIKAPPGAIFSLLASAPESTAGTLLRETWDVSRDKRKRMITSGSMPRQTERGMAATLERIAALLES